jgi:hypothetical protein
MSQNEDPKDGVPINFPESLRGGAYANSMIVHHTKEEFILDFIFVAPPAGSLVARIILSPGHVKRVLAALQENMAKYEGKFGTIKVAEEPSGELVM